MEEKDETYKQRDQEEDGDPTYFFALLLELDEQKCVPIQALTDTRSSSQAQGPR